VAAVLAGQDPAGTACHCRLHLNALLPIRTDVGLMSGWYIGLGVLYLVLLFTLAVMTFRKGHWVLGLIGFIFPILWIIGAILPARRRY
jgi:cadmium resistance protein CadD (predicted permease)